MNYKEKMLLLKDIPEPVYKRILEVQAKEKANNNGKCNLVQAVFKIIEGSIKKEK